MSVQNHFKKLKEIISGLLSHCSMFQGGMSQGSLTVILGFECSFRVNFSNNIADEIKSIFVKFAEDTRLRELQTL